MRPDWADLLHFGQLFKAPGNIILPKICQKNGK